MPTTKSYHTFLIDSLRDPEEAAAYLVDSVLEDGDPQHTRLALKNVAEARAKSVELKDAKWQQCYELLEKGEMPDLLMLVELLDQLNLRLSIAQKI